MVEEKRFYKLSEVARILGKTRVTIWVNYIKTGKLKAFRTGKNWEVDKAELERFIGRSIDSVQKEYLTPKECATVLNRDIWTIRRYITTGLNGLFLKARKINGVWMVHKQDLDKFIEERMGN